MFRKNVAALIRCNDKYLACFRSDHSKWQNVQGGIEDSDSSPIAAIIRETVEELGIDEQDFKIIYKSKYWRRYFFPKEILKKARFEGNIGQEQLWFLIEIKNINCVHLEKSVGEFQKVDLFTIDKFLELYSEWKKPSFYDFCRELGIIKI